MRKFFEKLGLLPVTVTLFENYAEGKEIKQREVTRLAKEWEVLLLAEQIQILRMIDSKLNKGDK